MPGSPAAPLNPAQRGCLGCFGIFALLWLLATISAMIPKTQGQLQAESDQRARYAADYQTFANQLRSIDNTGLLVRDIQYGHTTSEVVIVVSNDWFSMAHQVKLQAAQNLWMGWARIHSPGALDSAHLRLVDANGNHVGGSGMFGSIVSVDD